MVHGTRLVDKMVAAHRRLWLVLETLYLAVHGMDRYLATIEAAQAELHLVRVTALLIASKYEEIYPLLLCNLIGLVWYSF